MTWALFAWIAAMTAFFCAILGLWAAVDANRSRARVERAMRESQAIWRRLAERERGNP